MVITIVKYSWVHMYVRWVSCYHLYHYFANQATKGNMTVQIGFVNLYMIITMAIFPGDRIGHAYRICKFHHVPRYICIKDC